MAIIIQQGFAASSEGADEFIAPGNYDFITTGAVHWVYSVTGSNANPGTEAEPLATLAQAITNATASNGDIIIIKSGHTEALTSSISLNKAGVRIFGIGNGSSAPNFTVGAAIDGINITGNDCWISNLYFPKSTTPANTSRINVDASGVQIRSCTFLCGQYDPSTITVTANATCFRGESISMTVSEDGPDHGIHIESASARNLCLEDCTFNGATYGWDVGAVYSNSANLNFAYHNITLTGSNANISQQASPKGSISLVSSEEGNSVSS